MDWNNNNAFKILADMPTKLSKKNLEFLQSEIDKEKLAYSIEMNRDLCGEYAPFCAYCDKTEAYPCAIALIKFKQADGVFFEIAATDESSDVETEREDVTVGRETAIDSAAAPIVPEKRTAVPDTDKDNFGSEKFAETETNELPVQTDSAETEVKEDVSGRSILDAESPVTAENHAEPAPERVEERKKIRIAVAKRKHM